MSDVIISVENLGKKYRITHQAEQRSNYKTVREVVANGAKNIVQAVTARARRQNTAAPPFRSSREDFWALKDVSFEVKRGEAVGIIGRNGAGKSTLLKILSRITEPSEGRVSLKGRVASLLEVGTGFHPELTGRENIYLNGAIMGMARSEIRRKFDEIVAFAEVEKFLDTPVKRYSSGMYVRLAFAVAAHLESEILIVDEVLAVGDDQFQKKCLGKMQDVSRAEGRTVLFVSHNMQAVRTLCERGITLEGGSIRYSGLADEAIREYLKSNKMETFVEFPPSASRPAIVFIKLNKELLEIGTLAVEIGFKSPFPLTLPVGGIVISSSSGVPIFGTNPRFHKDGFGNPSGNAGVLRMIAEKLPIHGGTYHLSAWLGDWSKDYDQKRDALSFEFKMGTAPANTPPPESIGALDMPARWSVII